jgi:hypothetical protein
MTDRTFALPKTPTEIEAVARRYVPAHGLLLDAYSLSASSQCWRSRRGMTARLVYRRRDQAGAGIHTITMIIKGIPLT